MSKIVLISSGPSIAHYGLLLQKSLPDPGNFLIVDVYMEDALDYIRRNLPQDTDVIIARGNTAKLLKSAHLAVPVVTIPISDSELIASIKQARDLYKQTDSHIAYLGIEDVIQSVRGFLEVFHCHIRLYTINSSDDIRRSIQQAKRDHVNVVIGGIYTQKLALEAGLQCVLLESSLFSVKEAYERALEVQKGFIIQRKKFQERNILLNSITDGIISINEKGRITVLNPAAEQYLGISAKAVTGKAYAPLFAQPEKEVIQQCLTCGKQLSHHVFSINQQNFHLSLSPIVIGNDQKGLILTFHPFEKNMAPSVQIPIPPEDKPCFFQLQGSHPSFQMAVSTALQYAPLCLPIILAGEEGVGKETFAQCIHQAGDRADCLFIAREGALLTKEDLLSAHQGTLYIREGGRLSLPMQELLTEILKNGSIVLENGSRTTLNIRFIIGSQSSLADALLPRLYYLLNALILPLPSLCERSSDIPALTEHILKELNSQYQKNCSCTPEFLLSLCEYSWPGNIRQLKSFLTRLVVTASDQALFSSLEETGGPDDSNFYKHLNRDFHSQPFSEAPGLNQAQPGFIINGKKITYKELKILDEYYQGKKGLIAQKLGISRSTLWRYYKEAGLSG